MDRRNDDRIFLFYGNAKIEESLIGSSSNAKTKIYLFVIILVSPYISNLKPQEQHQNPFLSHLKDRNELKRTVPQRITRQHRTPKILYSIQLTH